MTKETQSAVASCLGCRKRHIKCHGNGVDPCPSCDSHGECCVYPKRRRAGPRKGWLQEREKLYQDALLELAAANDRIQLLENRLREHGAAVPSRTKSRSPFQSHHDTKLSEIKSKQLDGDWDEDAPNSPIIAPRRKRSRRQAAKVQQQEAEDSPNTEDSQNTGETSGLLHREVSFQLIQEESSPLLTHTKIKRELSDLDVQGFFTGDLKGMGLDRDPSWRRGDHQGLDMQLGWTNDIGDGVLAIGDGILFSNGNSDKSEQVDGQMELHSLGLAKQSSMECVMSANGAATMISPTLSNCSTEALAGDYGASRGDHDNVARMANACA